MPLECLRHSFCWGGWLPGHQTEEVPPPGPVVVSAPPSKVSGKLRIFAGPGDSLAVEGLKCRCLQDF